LKNKRSAYDKISKRVWKEIENRKTDKARMVEARRKRAIREEKKKRV